MTKLVTKLQYCCLLEYAWECASLAVKLAISKFHVVGTPSQRKQKQPMTNKLKLVQLDNQTQI